MADDETSESPLEVMVDNLTNEEVHEFGALNTLLLVVILTMCFLFAYLIKKYRCYMLPESASVMLLGAVVGFLATRWKASAAELEFLTFSPEVFYFGLLPPIIFDAGYMCRRKHFFQNFTAITLFAVVGTFISTFIIAYATYTVGRLGWVAVDVSSPAESLLFGALISAVNPVATLSVMDIIMGAESPGEKCDPLLYSLVFGESVLNDAVAIVLFHTFTKFYKSQQAGGMIVAAVGSFIVTSLASVATGCATGLACAYFCKHTDITQHPHLELSILFLFAYGSYALNEALELSGIMALFFCGIVLAHYNSYNLSDHSREAAEVTSKTLAQFSEFFIFLYMGLGFGCGKFTHWDPLFIGLSIVACLVARLFVTFPLSALANLRRPEGKKIGLSMQVVIWFSGLRGAIAFALSQSVPGDNHDLYVSTTLAVVFFTTIVGGALTAPLLTITKMRMRHGASDDNAQGAFGSAGSKGGSDGSVFGAGGDGSSESEEESAPLMKGQSHQSHEGSPRRWRRGLELKAGRDFRGFWRDFDERYIKPTFGGSAASSSDDMVVTLPIGLPPRKSSSAPEPDHAQHSQSAQPSGGLTAADAAAKASAAGQSVSYRKGHDIVGSKVADV